ncbi:hypothetical protein [Gordonia sp. OPL2]|uniref:hypothetical protein n=1 Tax=Gordonia sp. OPL2 TaxID=2486274 RepID=UPI00165504F1|nr:hypothetical protein [Gordonia sp. OPL2]RPA12620.1 hypothetical protein EEB19_05060 [Gordonia sp. OPL2]
MADTDGAPPMMAQLSNATGLQFSVASWRVTGSVVWEADTADGYTVSVAAETVPTRIAVSDDEYGARGVNPRTTLIADVAEAIAFSLIIARNAL